MKNHLLREIIMMSRPLFYVIFMQALFASFLHAEKGAAQSKSLYEIELKLGSGEREVTDVFKEIERETKFYFTFKDQHVLNKQVSLSNRKAYLGTFLEEISRSTDLRFKRINDNIHVYQNASDQLGIEESYSSESDQNSVSGTITDDNGEGLPGATVLEKGTSNGTITDVNGDFTISVGESASLTISFVGYQNQEIPVNGRTRIDVKLAADVSALQEVVVVGYGTQKKEDVTGAIVSANLDDMNKQPNVSVMEGLQGSVPGLNIGQVNQAGQNPVLNIRGQSSLSGEQNPLIVVDNVIFRGQLIDINPSDIKSVDILKDASAAAIYGSQAANGVIMITTKSGGSSNGMPTITYSGMYSFQQPHNELRAETNGDAFMLKIEHSDIFNSRTQSSGYLDRDPNWDQTTNFKTNHEINQFNAGRTFDWYDYMTTDNPYTSQHNLSISNSTESNNYYVSLGYTDQAGHMRDEYYSRINGRINLSTSVTEWFDFDIQSLMSLSEYGPQIFGLGDRFIEPYATPFDADGVLVDRPTGNQINPFYEETADTQDKRLNLNASLTGTIFLPIEGLDYKLRFGNNYQSNRNFEFRSFGANFTGNAFKENEVQYTWSLDNILSYNKVFGSIHELGITLLYGVEKRQSEFTRAEGSNFVNDILGYNFLQAAAADQQLASSGGWVESSLYNMARVSYKLMGKYLLNATIRRDGFSGFSQANKFGYFPSVAAGWILTEEGFMPDLDWLNWSKLRVSYGATGNRTIDRYQTLAKVNGDFGYLTGDGSSIYTQWISGLASSGLKWEKTTGINVGLDFKILGNRISGSIDYYNNNTTDLLYNVDIPAISRFPQVPDNLGKIHNKGLEILISSTNIQRNDFSWSTSLTFSRNRNEIVTLLGFDEDEDGKEDDLISEGLFIGESTGIIYDYEIDGIWQLGETIPTGYEFGAYRVVDVNGDGVIDPLDRTFVGNSRPAYRFGINNSLNYKKFNLSFFVNSIQGGKDRYLGDDTIYGLQIYNQENHFNITYPQGLDYWTPENPDARYQRPGIKGSAGIAGTRYTPRSFVRLRNVSLSYNMGADVIKFVRNIRITLSGRNLLTFTKWNGWDPETGQGINTGGRPIMEAYTVGIDVTF
ncbi:MAG: SusC/RagA family TonB-linked outer membrane protein [Bacteroidota bacterium]